jgi:ATP-dependent Clp protease ATP-binding subunit ClpB
MAFMPKPCQIRSHLASYMIDGNALGRLEQRLAQQNLTLDVNADAKKLLAKEGYDPQFGARPLKRAIQEHLLDPLATKLLAGEFKPADKIKVSAKGDELVFQKK